MFSLRACIFYLYTGKVNFLPLKSEGLIPVKPLQANHAPGCSPKSMYRLAEAVSGTSTPTFWLLRALLTKPIL